MTAKKRLLTDCLHVFVLTHFALVQPLLYRLSRKTVYLADQGIERGTLVVLLGLLCVVVPALICLVEVVAAMVRPRVTPAIPAAGSSGDVAAGKRAMPQTNAPELPAPRLCFGSWTRTGLRERVHAVIVFVLFALIALPILKTVKFLPGMVMLGLAPVFATLALVAYLRFASARLFVAAATPALVVFPSQFLYFSPVSRYLFHRPEPAPLRVAIRNPAPVVLLILDEFCGTSLMNRRGEIDCGRYPNFAALGETATWYRNATSVHPRTEMAVPAILSGKYPRGRRPATVAEYPSNLFTSLESTGVYEFVVFEPYTRLATPKPDEDPREPTPSRAQWDELAGTLPRVYLDHLFPIDVPFELPAVPLQWNAVRRSPPSRPDTRTGVFRYHWNSGRNEQFDEFLRRIEPLGQPALYFSHLVVPHAPWCFLPSGHPYTPDNGPIGLVGASGDSETWMNDELAALQGYQRYLLQVGYADHQLGKLMARLREADLFDRCLLVVTADHGAAFWPGLSRRLPVDRTLQDIMAVPLFVKLPGQRDGHTSDRNAESVDVMPTIVDVLGLDIAIAFDGSSLLDTTRPERTQKRFFDDARELSIDAAFPAKQTTLERMVRQFGDGDEPSQLFRVGPHSELIGRAVDEFTVAERANVQLTLTDPRKPAPPKSEPIVPCYFAGRATSRDGPAQPIALAIAVNGTIQAVTRTYTGKPYNDYWCAIVPESALAADSNEVQIYVVSTTNSRVTLRPALDAPLQVSRQISH
jgi:hypothetical protein